VYWVFQLFEHQLFVIILMMFCLCFA